jgi:hypothetical protein
LQAAQGNFCAQGARPANGRAWTPIYPREICGNIHFSNTLGTKHRLARDLLLRDRKRASVVKQFCDTVEPMNAQYVAPKSAGRKSS